ncbi:MAG TPA: hypothetical protein DCE41_29440 [Cytophagales bacterium]|nr:hypothetical protein [Cytophagales bacterium]HAA18572.1 hypothetical protein [Cytophagales bacterium]HAP60199.1 hypothetical protein [Cytophagales bacterium]
MTKLNTRLAYFDWSESGIIKATTHPIDPTPEEVEEYLAGFNTMISSVSGPYVIFVDASQAKWYNSKARTQLALGADALQKKYEGRNQGSFVVVGSAIVKMSLQGINLIFKNQARQRVFTSYAKALAAARAKIAEVNKETPSSIKL